MSQVFAGFMSGVREDRLRREEIEEQKAMEERAFNREVSMLRTRDYMERSREDAALARAADGIVDFLGLPEEVYDQVYGYLSAGMDPNDFKKDVQSGRIKIDGGTSSGATTAEAAAPWTGEVVDPTTFNWGQYAVGGAASRADSFTGLDSEFSGRVAAMLRAADEELGAGALKITSAYRSPELQAKLFEEAVAKYGSEEAARKWVAPPGRSRHNSGTAVDFGDANGGLLRDADSREAQWIRENASRFGLDVPMEWEPWQVEIAGSRDGGGKGGSPEAEPVDTQMSDIGFASAPAAAGEEELTPTLATREINGDNDSFPTEGPRLVVQIGESVDLQEMQKMSRPALIAVLATEDPNSERYKIADTIAKAQGIGPYDPDTKGFDYQTGVIKADDLEAVESMIANVEAARDLPPEERDRMLADLEAKRDRVLSTQYDERILDTSVRYKTEITAVRDVRQKAINTALMARDLDSWVQENEGVLTTAGGAVPSFLNRLGNEATAIANLFNQEGPATSYEEGMERFDKIMSQYEKELGLGDNIAGAGEAYNVFRAKLLRFAYSYASSGLDQSGVGLSDKDLQAAMNIVSAGSSYSSFSTSIRGLLRQDMNKPRIATNSLREDPGIGRLLSSVPGAEEAFAGLFTPVEEVLANSFGMSDFNEWVNGTPQAAPQSGAAPSATTGTPSSIIEPPPGAVGLLLENADDPAVREQFDQKYGPGMADSIIQINRDTYGDTQ